MNVFIDIETIPGPDMPPLDAVKAPANYKKPESIAAWLEQNGEAERITMWRKEALQALKGRILVVGLAVDDEPPVAFDAFSGTPGAESVLLRQVQDYLADHDASSGITWVGHNSKSFDMQWIALRAKKYGVDPLGRWINLDRFRGNVEDTMVMAAHGDTYSNKYPLDALCKFFGIDGKPHGKCPLCNGAGCDECENGILHYDGSKVFPLWQAGHIDHIKDYCKADVEMTRQLYHKLAA